MPLRYLIKHPAFEEEQECQMFYITTVDDKKIKVNFENKFMYINYESSVIENIDHIKLWTGGS